MGGGEGGLESGTRHHFTRNGRLVANKQLVYKIHQDMGIASVSYKLQSLKALLSIRRTQVTTLDKMKHKKLITSFIHIFESILLKSISD